VRGFFTENGQAASVPTESRSLLARSLPLVGVAYLGYLATQPPPARWVGLACLAVVAPFAVGWALGRFGGIGPWSDGE
jgi:hypothetical protein